MSEQIILYTTKDDETIIDVKLENESVWLTQKQMAELFNRDRKTITRHISNLFKEAELLESSVCSFFEHTANDGKKYQTKLYNLDVIISVGYRVKSKRGTQFRIWANTILKKYLIKGYVLNEKRLKEEAEKLLDLQKTIKRLDKVEQTQIESDKKFEQLFKALEKFTKSHDRFLIIDQTTVYHFGASLKDLGKRWFAFSKMNIEAMEMITKVASSGVS